MCFLRHGKHNTLTTLDTGETLRRLIETTWFFSWSPESIPLTMEVLGELAETVAAYEYAFVPDLTAVRALEAVL